MAKFRRDYSEDSSWQAVYMDLITLLMLFFLIMWVKQQGGDGVPVETNKIIPFQKISVSDSSFSPGKTNLTKSAIQNLSNNLTRPEIQKTLGNLGYSEEKDKFYYITVHGHGSLSGNFEQNMNISLGRARAVAEQVKSSFLKTDKALRVNKDPIKDDRYMISVCGHSYNFPKVNLDKNLSGKQKREQQSINRRVDIMYHEVPGNIMKTYFMGK